MYFEDYFCYLLPYMLGLKEAYLHGTYLYSPTFMFIFYPFMLIPFWAYQLFIWSGFACLIWVCRKYNPWIQLAIYCTTIFTTFDGNLDVWICVVLIAWYPHIERNPFASGLIVGFFTFKPIVGILVIFYWKKTEKIPFFLGFTWMVIFNYITFLFDPSLIVALLHAARFSNHIMGLSYLLPFHYSWFNFYYVEWTRTLPKPFQYFCLYAMGCFFPPAFLYIVSHYYNRMKDPNYDQKININRNNKPHLSKIKRAKKRLEKNLGLIERCRQLNIVSTHSQNLK